MGRACRPRRICLSNGIGRRTFGGRLRFPTPGNSTPIIWGDRVFITQASDKKQWPPKVPANYAGGASAGGHAIAEKRSVMCFHAQRRQTPLAARHDLQGTGDHASDQSILLGVTGHRRRTRDRLPRLRRTGLLRLRGKAALAIRRRQARASVGQRVVADHSRRLVHPVVRSRRAAVPARRRQAHGEESLGNSRAGGDPGITSKKFLGTWATPIIARVGERGSDHLSAPFKLAGYDPKTGKQFAGEGAGHVLLFLAVIGRRVGWLRQ